MLGDDFVATDSLNAPLWPTDSRHAERECSRWLVLGEALGVVLVGGLVFMRASSAVEEFDIPPVIAPVTPPPSVPPVAPTEELAAPSVVSVERLALTATVNSITGSSAVAAGATCSFEVAFTTFSNSITECHTDIVCGNNVHVYGGTESGFFPCQFSTSPARVVGEDVYTTAPPDPHPVSGALLATLGEVF